MSARLLADTLVAIHFAFIAFVIAGGILAFKHRGRVRNRGSIPFTWDPPRPSPTVESPNDDLPDCHRRWLQEVPDFRPLPSQRRHRRLQERRRRAGEGGARQGGNQAQNEESPI